jgi:hypothetical protein
MRMRVARQQDGLRKARAAFVAVAPRPCSAAPGYDQASGWGSLNVGAVSTVLNGSPQYQISP